MLKPTSPPLSHAPEGAVAGDSTAGAVTPVLSAPPLTRQSAQTLTEQLAERFAARIRDRLLAPGARLPSVRQCAAQQGLSPSTVVAAYDLLLAQGLVQAERNRGFFVRQRVVTASASPGKQPLPGLGLGLRAGPPVNAGALLRGMFQPPGERPQPGMGAFPPDWMETSFLQAAVRRVTSMQGLNDVSLRYGEPMGDGHLRRVLSDRLNGLGLPAEPGQIITTIGATQALDIVSRTLLKPGDCVMVEEPGWAIEFARLNAQGLRILPVPRGPTGPDLAVMARYCAEHAPKLFVSVSVLHNPTGHCLTPASAHRVMQLAQTHQFYVVEDDTYSHIAPEHATRMSVLDGLQRTIYVSGFSKVLAPGLRLGYLVAPQALYPKLLQAKQAADLHTPGYNQRMVVETIKDGFLDRHVPTIRSLYKSQCDAMLQALGTEMQGLGLEWNSPDGGMFLWVRLPEGMNAVELLPKAVDAGVAFVPGAAFYADNADPRTLRLSFVTASVEQIRTGITALARAIRDFSNA